MKLNRGLLGGRESTGEWIESKYIVCMYGNVIMKPIILYNRKEIWKASEMWNSKGKEKRFWVRFPLENSVQISMLHIDIEWIN
jgi:hypothetical protein